MSSKKSLDFRAETRKKISPHIYSYHNFFETPGKSNHFAEVFKVQSLMLKDNKIIDVCMDIYVMMSSDLYGTGIHCIYGTHFAARWHMCTCLL